MELVQKKEFITTAVDRKNETVIIHIATLAHSSSNVHSSRRAYIVSLKANKIFITILNEYADFTDVFLPDLADELLEYTRINDHVIHLIDSQ